MGPTFPADLVARLRVEADALCREAADTIELQDAVMERILAVSIRNLRWATVLGWASAALCLATVALKWMR